MQERDRFASDFTEKNAGILSVARLFEEKGGVKMLWYCVSESFWRTPNKNRRKLKWQ